MARVPKQVADVPIGRPSTPLFNTGVYTPDAFGAAQARGNRDMGKAVAGLGDVAFEIGLKEQAKENKRLLDEEKAAYLKLRNDLEWGDNGWRKSKGEDAARARQDAVNALQSHRDEIMAKWEDNAAVRAGFDGWSANNAAAMDQEASNHAYQEHEKVRIAAQKAKTEELRRQAVFNPTSEHLNELYDTLVEDAMLEGVDEPTARSMAQQNMTVVHENVMDNYLDNGSVEDAKEYLDLYRRDMNPDKVGDFEKRIADEVETGNILRASTEAWEELSQIPPGAERRAARVAILEAAAEKHGVDSDKMLQVASEVRALEQDERRAKEEAAEGAQQTAMKYIEQAQGRGKDPSAWRSSLSAEELLIVQREPSMVKALNSYAQETIEGKYSAVTPVEIADAIEAEDETFIQWARNNQLTPTSRVLLQWNPLEREAFTDKYNRIKDMKTRNAQDIAKRIWETKVGKNPQKTGNRAQRGQTKIHSRWLNDFAATAYRAEQAKGMALTDPELIALGDEMFEPYAKQDRWYWFNTQAMPAYRVQVDEEDLKEARKTIKQQFKSMDGQEPPEWLVTMYAAGGSVDNLDSWQDFRADTNERLRKESQHPAVLAKGIDAFSINQQADMYYVWLTRRN